MEKIRQAMLAGPSVVTENATVAEIDPHVFPRPRRFAAYEDASPDRQEVVSDLVALIMRDEHTIGC